MNNLVQSNISLSFFVWVDPENFLIKQNLYKIGALFSIPDSSDSDNLMFIRNEKFKGFTSPFQTNVVWNYLAEYNLELSRVHYFIKYPSRLTAIFLFDSKNEAMKYKERYPEHVSKRKLEEVESVGNYIYSKHDCSWVDFLRHPYGKLSDTIDNVCKSYWQGKTVENSTLMIGDKYWGESPIFEILYTGQVKLKKNNKY